jgi:hypothetical protein
VPPTPLAGLLVLSATPSPRPRLSLTPPSRRTRGTVVRAAAFRALPRRLELWPPRLSAVESGPPSRNPSAPPLQPGVESQGAIPGLAVWVFVSSWIVPRAGAVMMRVFSVQ